MRNRTPCFVPGRRAAPILCFAVCLALAAPAAATDIADIYAEALDNDPQLARARASAASVREGVTMARASFLPRLSANASRSRGRSVREPSARTVGGVSLSTPGRTTDTSRNNWGASLSQNVLSMPDWFRYRGAKASAQRADWELQSAAQDLIIRVARAYLGVLRTQAGVESAVAAEEAVRRQLEQVQQRFDVGLVAITDVLESKAEYDNAVVLRIQSEGNHDNSFEQLRTLTGRVHTAIDGIAETLPIVDPAPADEADWVAAAMTGNGRLGAARLRLEAAEQDLKAAISAPLPTVTASVNYGSGDGSSAFNGQVFQDPGSSSINYSVTLNVPLFQGLREFAGMKQARLAAEMARQTLLQEELAIAESVRNLLRTVKVHVVRVQARGEAIKSAEAALQATQTGYEVGTRNIVDVLQAQRRLFQSQLDYATARYDYMLDQLRLKQAAGTLDEQDIAALQSHADAANRVQPVQPTSNTAQPAPEQATAQ